jgi:hypothetical protein
MPPGGATGQVLSKVNADDFNTEWVDAGDGPGVGYAYNHMRSSFLFDGTGWNAGAGSTPTYGQTAAPALIGVNLPRVFTVNIARAVAGDGYIETLNAYSPRVIPGDTLQVSCWIRTLNLTNNAASLRIIVRNAAGAAIADMLGTDVVFNTDWTLVEDEFTMPANAAAATIRFRVSGVGNADFSGPMVGLNSPFVLYRPNPDDNVRVWF